MLGMKGVFLLVSFQYNFTKKQILEKQQRILSQLLQSIEEQEKHFHIVIPCVQI
ncbi:MAG: hypothetical protein ACI94Y_001489 [Maribacter sp.]|jgi:hypothetical protein